MMKQQQNNLRRRHEKILPLTASSRIQENLQKRLLDYGVALLSFNDSATPFLYGAK